MNQGQESRGLILFARNHREKDKLVKIFTEKYGKLMFFVRRGNHPNSPLAAAILPFTEATYIGVMKADGLSFLNDVKEIKPFHHLQQDIFSNAYATYILNLVDAAIEDRQPDFELYGFTKNALQLLSEGQDPEIITNIFELQILKRFGFSFNWERCAICGQTEGKFDFSSQYSGVLCEEHFYLDSRRYHASPRAIHFLRLFAHIRYDQIDSVSLKTTTKNEIRQTLDLLYDEFVGIQLKSKKFIDQMKNWEATLKDLPPRD